MKLMEKLIDRNWNDPIICMMVEVSCLVIRNIPPCNIKTLIILPVYTKACILYCVTWYQEHGRGSEPGPVLVCYECKLFLQNLNLIRRFCLVHVFFAKETPPHENLFGFWYISYARTHTQDLYAHKLYTQRHAHILLHVVLSIILKSKC